MNQSSYLPLSQRKKYITITPELCKQKNWDIDRLAKCIAGRVTNEQAHRTQKGFIHEGDAMYSECHHKSAILKRVTEVPLPKDFGTERETLDNILTWALESYGLTGSESPESISLDFFIQKSKLENSKIEPHVDEFESIFLYKNTPNLLLFLVLENKGYEGGELQIYEHNSNSYKFNPADSTRFFRNEQGELKEQLPRNQGYGYLICQEEGQTNRITTHGALPYNSTKEGGSEMVFIRMHIYRGYFSQYGTFTGKGLLKILSNFCSIITSCICAALITIFMAGVAWANHG